MTVGPVTELLSKIRYGDKAAEDTLFSLVYRDLHKMASRFMKGEQQGHLLQATALVNETYLRMFRSEDGAFETRNHFFAFAAQVMRSVLVDFARANNSTKRGGGQRMMAMLDNSLALAPAQLTLVIAVDDALKRLFKLDPRQAKVVEMYFFAGMKCSEIAIVLAVSDRTVKRDLAVAKAWLYGELST